MLVLRGEVGQEEGGARRIPNYGYISLAVLVVIVLTTTAGELPGRLLIQQQSSMQAPTRGIRVISLYVWGRIHFGLGSLHERMNVEISSHISDHRALSGCDLWRRRGLPLVGITRQCLAQVYGRISIPLDFG